MSNTNDCRYFAESFLGVIGDDHAVDDSLKEGDVNYHTALLTDGVSPLKLETDDKNYTALGDHIVRASKKYKQCSALLSLDPCVNASLRARLNGEKRLLKPQFTTKFSAEKIESISGHGNVVVDYEKNNLGYYTRKFNYTDIDKDMSRTLSRFQKAIYVNSGNPSKVLSGEQTDEDVVFSTQAGIANDVSKSLIFGPGKMDISDSLLQIVFGDGKDKNLRHSDFQNQYRYMLRGLYSPFIGIDDRIIERKKADPNYNSHLTDNAIYNIYSESVGEEPDNPEVIKNQIVVRSQDKSPFYAVSDRFDLSNTSTDVYRGDCYSCTVTIRLNRNFVDPTVPIVDEILDQYSWVNNFKGFYKTTAEDYAKINRADVNAVSLGMWVTFKCLSSYNLGLRAEDRSHTDEMALMGNPRSFYPLQGISTKSGRKIEESYILNDGYNATVGRRDNYEYENVPYINTEHSTRIMFSNKAVQDSFNNGFRTFQGASFHDYDSSFGGITKILSLTGSLFCVFEHGCAIIPVNEKALMQTTDGQPIAIYGHGVLADKMQVVSQDVGSMWADSVYRTPIGIYGVDTYVKKIWKFSEGKGFETLSDMKIQRFLNDNILLSEGDHNAELCIKNVATHYNMYKGDVMFTFYNYNAPVTGDGTVPNWNICYNERQGIWTTRYS